MQVADTGSLYNGIIPVPSPVIPAAPMMSFQCPLLVIPVRDTGISFYFMMMS
ncbi:hypothetical protein [Wolbachia endosymbiont (group A) of Barypeithes pellucidus]|uniref:hypothetical protein n=1 Tax=Wolbachia endosymbiont (group A) of Barypeithes pellucidus TaxID=3139322 RepID=UPI003CCB4A72